MNIELGTNEQRFLITASGQWRDLLTGRLIPVIQGSDGEDDEQEDDGSEDDDGDDGDEELSRLQAEMTKQNRAGGKKAVRELARKYGFGSRAELEAFLASAGEGDDDDKNDDSGSASSSQSDDTGKPPARPQVSVENDPVRQRELRLEVREALFEVDVVPSKAKLATATVVGLIDLTDPDLDAEDIAEAVEDMRTSEPGWFLDSDDGDGSGGGRAVPGAGGRKPRKKPAKTSEEVAAEIYEQRKKARQPRRRLVGGSTQ